MDWTAKVGIQKTPGVTGKFGVGVQNEGGQRLTEFYQENALVITNTHFQQTREDSTHVRHQIVRYDLNQIPYHHTVKVTNKFKGSNMIECLMNYGWRFMMLYRRQ